MIKTAAFCLFLLTVVTPRKLTSATARAFEPVFVVWNVGQGLWTTYVDLDLCEHFDLGGERAPWAEITRACGKKLNRLHFSHWDWDHVRFARSANKRLARVCLASAPGGVPSPKRRNWLTDLNPCEPRHGGDSRTTLSPTMRELSFTAGKRSLRSNEASRVFLLQDQILLPGDSTRKEEKLWSLGIRPGSGVKVLVLGHHGSNTSTSLKLLRQMPQLKLAIASARKKKYGHPHPSVVDRLRSHGVGVLETEIWGSIHMELRKGWRADSPTDARYAAEM